MFQKLNEQVLWLQIKALNALADFIEDERGSEFNDGGSSNWGRNVAIGFAIAAVLFGLVKAFMPEIVDAWKAKVLEFFQ